MDALLHVLSTANIKYSNGKICRNYTKTTLLEDFENKSQDEFIQFKINLAKWAKNIHNSEGFCDSTINEIRTFINSKFCPLFGIPENQYISQFLNNITESTATKEEIINNNIFMLDDIEVEVSTIHSVKGETHAATLYLETGYQGEHEGTRILEQFKGNYYVPPADLKKDVYRKEALKMAHVGMSRPKYFLCVAIHKDRFDRSSINLLDIRNGGMWEIVNV